VLVLCGDAGIPIHGPSGASNHLRSVVRALAELGHEVRIAAPRLADDRGHWDHPLPASLVTCEPRSFPSFLRERGETWGARRLATRAIAGWTPDLIWERHALFVDAGQRLAARLGCPRVVELNAPLSLERTHIRSPGRARRLEGESLRSADSVAAVSAWLAQWAIQDAGCAGHRVHHIPNGSDVTLGNPSVWRERFGQDTLLIGFVGSCRPWHQLHRLGPILDVLPDAVAVVVGDGPCPPPHHARLHHVGRVQPTDLDDLLAAFDVGLNLGDDHSRPWSCPLKLADYAASGLPIISDPNPEVHKLAGSLAMVPDDSTPQSWARAIRSQCAAGTRASNVRSRTWHTVVRETLHSADLCQKGSRPAKIAPSPLG
jgi:glycosyltransferase involved in cell wall biosynthesis